MKSKKRCHPKPSALTSTTICHKPICNFFGLFQLCALNIQDESLYILEQLSGSKTFFSCQILNVRLFSSFSTWCNDSSASVHFWQLKKIPLKLKRDVLLLDEGWKCITKTHSLWNFVHKATLKNDTLTAELSSTLWKVKHTVNPQNIFPVISAAHAANRHMHYACC